MMANLWRGACCARLRGEHFSGEQPKAMLTEHALSGILSDMKVVSIRQFHRESRFERLAAGGEEVVVTRNGKPYYRVLPAPVTRSFLGAAQTGEPLTDLFLAPAVQTSEWEAAR